MGRAAKWTCADQRRNSADGNSVVSGRVAARQRFIVAVEGALHDAVEVSVAAAQKDAASNAAFYGALNALRAKGLSIDGKSVVVGVVKTECSDQLLLFGRGETRNYVGQQPSADVFNLLAELVMKVAGAEDQPVAKKILLHAALIGANSGRSEWRDAELLGHGLETVGYQKLVEGAELIRQRRFPNRIAEIEKDARSAENALARTERIERESGARRGLRSKQRVALQASSQRVKESILEVTMHRGKIVVVSSLSNLVLTKGGDILKPPLILVVKADQCDQVRCERVIALVNQLIAIGDQLVLIRISLRIVKNSAAGSRVAIGAGNRHLIAEAISKGVEESAAALLPKAVLLALAGQSVANAVMKRGRRQVIDRGTHENVLVLLRSTVGHVIKVPRIRHPRRIDAVVQRSANLRGAARLPTGIGRSGGHVELVHGQRIPCLQPTERAQVIEFVVSAGHFELLARSREVAGVALKKNRWKAGGAVFGAHADHAALGTSAVQVRIRPAINFGSLDSSGGKWTEVELIAHIARVHAVQQHHVGIRIAASNKHRGLRPQLAGLHHKCSRHQPQCAHQIVSQSQIHWPNHAGGRAGLRLRRRCPCRGDHNRLAHPLRLKHHVALNVVELAGIKTGRLDLPEALGRNHQVEAAGSPCQDLKAAVGGGYGRGSLSSVADQDHIGAAHLGAGRVGHHAVNGRGHAYRADGGKQNGYYDGGQCADQAGAQICNFRHDGLLRSPRNASG